MYPPKLLKSTSRSIKYSIHKSEIESMWPKQNKSWVIPFT